MKIAIYTKDFAPVVGGVQTVILELARGLVEWREHLAGHPPDAFDVTVATPTPAGGLDDSNFPFRVVRQPSVLKLFNLFRMADVIHLAGPSILPMCLALALGKPVVVEHDGYQAICPSGIYVHEPHGTTCPGHFQIGNYRECLRCQSMCVSRFRSAWNLMTLFPRRWLAKQVAANVAVSNHTGQRIALPRTQTIYHGIAAPKCSSPAPPSVQKPLILAYVGRLVPEKGVDVLLRGADEASKNGCDFRLKIIGDGPERRRLELLAAKLELNKYVEFLGFRMGSSLELALADVSIAVIPSQWEEACPMSAIEQMMQGKLMIAADIGAVSELVADTGLKFPPADASALAACIRRAVEDPQLVAYLSAAGCNRAMSLFSVSKMTQEHIVLYRQLMQRNG